jgi:hypothetical protein
MAELFAGIKRLLGEADAAKRCVANRTRMALLITDFQRPLVQMMLQRLQTPRQFPRRFLRDTPHRGLSFGDHIQLEYGIG